MKNKAKEVLNAMNFTQTILSKDDRGIAKPFKFSIRKMNKPRTTKESLLPTEHQEQVAVIHWFRMQYPNKLLFAIPNGGTRGNNATQAMINRTNMKREGVVSGIPDLMLAEASNAYHGLWIEMKRIGGSISDSQRIIKQQLQQNGYCVVVCYGFEAARKAIQEYIENAKNA